MILLLLGCPIFTPELMRAAGIAVLLAPRKPFEETLPRGMREVIWLRGPIGVPETSPGMVERPMPVGSPIRCRWLEGVSGTSAPEVS